MDYSKGYLQWKIYELSSAYNRWQNAKDVSNDTALREYIYFLDKVRNLVEISEKLGDKNAKKLAQ